MDPLRHVGRTSSELPHTADPSAQSSPRPTAGPVAGVETRVRVLADLGQGTYAVRYADRQAAVLVRSSTPLPTDRPVDLRVVSPERPPVLVAVPDSAVDRGASEAARAAARTAGVPFEALVGGSRPSSGAPAPVGPLAQVPTAPQQVARALLAPGSPVAADTIRTAAGQPALVLAGARLAVHVDGAPAPPGGVYAVARAARPAQVEPLTPAPPTAPAPPAWLGPLLHALEASDGRAPNVGEALARLARSLRERAAASPGARPAAEREARERLGAELRPPTDGRELAERIARGGTRFEHLARSAQGDAARALGDDLRGVLGRLVAGEVPGAVRESAQRALESLTTNALLVAARAESGEMPWSPLPLADGDGATTAWIRWRGGDGARAERTASGLLRAEIAVEFSATGPVRVDAVVAADRVAVRVTVSNDDVLERVRAAGDRLAAELSIDGRHVLFGASVDEPANLRVDADRPPAMRHEHDARSSTHAGPDYRGTEGHWVDAVG